MTSLRQPIPLKYLFVLLAGGVAIAFAPIFVRFSETGPVSTAMWRLALSAPFFFAWLMKSPSPYRMPVRWRDHVALILAGLFLAADLGLWHISILQTSLANATFLLNLAPIFVMIGAHFLFKELIGFRFVLALLAAVLGAGFLVFGKTGALGVAALGWHGDAIALLAAFFYAGYQLAIKHCRKYFRTSQILLVTALVMPLSLIPVVGPIGEIVVPATLHGWMIVLGCAVVCQVLGQGLITAAMRHLPANLGSIGLLIQPVAVIGLGAWLVGEWPSMLQLAGCLLILVAIMLATAASQR